MLDRPDHAATDVWSVLLGIGVGDFLDSPGQQTGVHQGIGGVNTRTDGDKGGWLNLQVQNSCSVVGLSLVGGLEGPVIRLPPVTSGYGYPPLFSRNGWQPYAG